MLDFLTFFNVGTSLFNSYANFRANKEKTNQALYEQRHMLRISEEQANFDRRSLTERTAEYGAISSYHVDMLRQEQMHNRQVLGYNILQSGIGITGTDSAGLLLKHIAYMDEMKAKSVEAEYFHQRPRSNHNPALAELQKEAVNRNIKGIKSASPWVTAGTILGGVKDLADIADPTRKK